MSGVNSEVVKRKRIALNYTQEKLAEKAELSEKSNTTYRKRKY